MNTTYFAKRLDSFLRLRCYELPIEVKVFENIDTVIAKVNNIPFVMDLCAKSITVDGHYSQIAYIIAGKVGSVANYYWQKNSESSYTFVSFGEKFSAFMEKCQIFIVMASIFRDLGMTKFFTDKKCLIEINDEDVHIRLYHLHGMVVIMVNKDGNSIIEEIPEAEMSEKLNTPKEAMDAARKKAKELAEEQEQVESSTEPKRHAVYGDNVEGTVKNG